MSLTTLVALCLLSVTVSAVAPFQQLRQQALSSGSSSSFVEVSNPSKQTWAEWRTVKDDNHAQKFGFEIEIKRTYVQMGGHEEFAKWYYANNHHAAYQGIGEWSDLEIHLDDNSALGNGTLFEMVSKPLGVTAISKLLEKLRGTLKVGTKKAALMTWINANFAKVNDPSVPENAAAYRHIEANLVVQNVGDANFFPRMMQITTTLTVPEMKGCRHGAVAGLWKEIGEPNSEADMLRYLNTLVYTGTKPSTFIVKHCAEQFMPEFAAERPPTIPEDGFAGVELAYKLHTKADKLAPLFKRNGNFAYVIEFRGSFSAGVEQKVATWMRTPSTGREQLTPYFDEMMGCSRRQ